MGKNDVNLILKDKTKIIVKSSKQIEKACFVLNCLTLVLSITFLLNQSFDRAWNTFGALFMITLLLNLGAMYRESKRNQLKYIYLFCFMLIMMVTPYINTAISLITERIAYINFITYILLLTPLVMAAMILFLDIKGETTLSNRKVIGIGFKKRKRLISQIALGISLIFLLSGLYYSYCLLSGNNKGYLGLIAASFSVFQGFVFIGSGVTALKLLKKKNRRVLKLSVMSVSLILFLVCMLPLILMPKTIKQAQHEFAAAFSSVKSYSIKEEYKDSFTQYRFSLPQYFFGTADKDFKLKENILFYEGNVEKEKGLKLYFDAYTPSNTDENLPGRNSTLIRIHGGAWVSGDKGVGNMAQVNKYFASQGYTVFDIQYGLNNKAEFNLQGVTPAFVRGDYDIDDMIRHIGIFTKYLEAHKDEYGANLDSVFISGGSAGGHLVTAAGLGIASGKYSDIFSSKLKVKGIIPLYPANGLSVGMGIAGKADLVNPTLNLDKNSPPTLIYQGTRDALVNSRLSEAFKESYFEKASKSCAVLMMPLAGHGSDIYFSTYYNQLFMYYMERFMYMYK
jgi:acetyl esterase/lipase